jgi:hypothetical protein
VRESPPGSKPTCGTSGMSADDAVDGSSTGA